MMFSFFFIFQGYCYIVLSGKNQERFLNLCASKHLLLWGLQRKEGHCFFYVGRKDVPYLEEISQKTACSYRCLKKKGLPYLLFRYRKRKLFVCTAIACGICLYLMSTFLWQIRVYGSYSHSEEELLEYMQNKGVKSGIKKKNISCEQLEREIREDFEDIAWVSCELKGTLLNIQVKETLGKKDEIEEKMPCSLVASKDGRIDSIVVRSGEAKVKKGDSVKAGDVLISGEVGLYDDFGTMVETDQVCADGDIFAITSQPYEDTFSLLEYEKSYTGREAKTYQLCCQKHLISLPDRIPFFSQALFEGKTFASFDEKTERYALHIGRFFYLPVEMIVNTKMECQVTQKKLDEKEAKEKAQERILLFLAQFESKGVEILKKNVRIYFDNGNCTVRGTIQLKERFGKVQELSDIEK